MSRVWKEHFAVGKRHVSEIFILCCSPACSLILIVLIPWESYFFLPLLFHKTKKQSEEKLIRLGADVPSFFLKISTIYISNVPTKANHCELELGAQSTADNSKIHTS